MTPGRTRCGESTDSRRHSASSGALTDAVQREALLPTCQHEQHPDRDDGEGGCVNANLEKAGLRVVVKHVEAVAADEDGKDSLSRQPVKQLRTSVNAKLHVVQRSVATVADFHDEQEAGEDDEVYFLQKHDGLREGALGVVRKADRGQNEAQTGYNNGEQVQQGLHLFLGPRDHNRDLARTHRHLAVHAGAG
eukprot:CAMPEP_0178998350 /NCGR_PEP_ID=MMETSP0795-20121207/9467_1 /TAXON_ID=88552 /ORGANISM="Amoebophrya sp., Strain Ameob2" /LENGTH=191 /DNA_ID=CAMNT_0020691025 /DNA_START=499 /DNA_END=1075 /DNA_ORIENTATION=+